MKKIGILKQSFDPISLQDIFFVKDQIKKMNLDEVYLIILDMNNLVNISNREEMISLAIQNEDNIILTKFYDISNDNNILLVNNEATIIRNKILKGNFSLLDEKVKNYILKNSLYLEEIVKNTLSKKRYEHSMSVANLAVDLAKSHNYDINKAYITGILHDITKEMPYEYTMEIMKKYFKELLVEPYPLYHAYTGAVFIKNNLLIDDEEILKAIYFHTIGTHEDTLSKIIYIADKLDPSRGYDSSKQIEFSKKDLNEGFKLVKEEAQNYIKEKNK
ncbi:MAG: HD domain-containing protein [Erysipelotrichaceae bacterium]|nr:HD domain-containing protein [Erysipelotrichaceae bacterium]